MVKNKRQTSIILDKTQLYKTIAVLLGVASLVLSIGFFVTVANLEMLSLVTALLVLFGVAYGAFAPVVTDAIAEMTYPITESVSLVLPITLGGLYRVPVTFLFSHFVKRGEYYTMLWILVGLVALSLVFVFIPKIQRNRTEAGKTARNEEGTNFNFL